MFAAPHGVRYDGLGRWGWGRYGTGVRVMSLRNSGASTDNSAVELRGIARGTG